MSGYLASSPVATIGGMSQILAIAICTQSLTGGARMLIFPAGQFNASAGAMEGEGPWVIDAKAAAMVIGQARARGNDLPVDYEHQTLLSASNGQPAPAAGWISPASLEWVEGEGLIGQVRWTEKAAAMVAAGEYRYHSPVFEYDKRTGAVRSLLHVGLVNSPAIDNIPEVTSRAAAKFQSTATGDGSMNEELLKLLGLTAEATDDEALAALRTLQQQLETQGADIAALQQQLNDKDAEVAAAKGETPDSAMGVIKTLQSELAALKGQVEGSQVDQLVAAAIDEGKLVPAQEEWARGLGVAGLQAYLKDAPQIAALKGQQSQGKQILDERNALSDTDRAICAAMGIAEDDYKANLATH